MSNNLAASQRFDPLSAGVSGGFSDIYESALGPAPRAAAANPYDGKSYSRVNMPAEYEGKNYVVRDTMEDYMLTAEYDFYTKYILPYFRTDQIEVTWKEWQNSPAYMGPTPHGSTSRVITKKRIIRRASVIRRGLTYEFEDDHVMTAGGRSQWWASVAALARAFQETANVEVLRALRNAHTSEQAYVREYKLVPMGDLDAYHERISERFMIVQKEDTGIETLNTLVDQEQEEIGGEADAWIYGREVMDYCDTANPLKTRFDLGGQEAVDRLNGRSVGAGAAANTMGNVRNVAPRFQVKGTPVFLAKSNMVDGLGKADLLSRIVEVGIYNLMADRTRDFRKYDKAARDLRFYCNDKDDWHVESFCNAIDNLSVWEKNGQLWNPFAQQRQKTTLDEKDFLSYHRADAPGTRANIDYIGDMSSNYVHAQHFVNAAQTLLTAITYNDDAKAKELMDGYALDEGNPDAKERRLAVFTGMLTSILGADNVFMRNGGTSNVTSAGLAPGNTAPGYAAVQSRVGGDAIEAKHKAFLSQVIAAPLAGGSEAARRIVDDSATHWEQRAQKIKAVVLDSLRTDPTSVTALESPADVDAWFNARTQKYRQQVAAAAPVEAEVASTTPVRYDGPLADTMPALIGAHVMAPGSREPFSEQQERARRATDRRGAAGGISPNLRYANMSHNIEAVRNSGAHPLLRDLAILYMGTRFTRDALKRLNNANVALLLNIMLARPHCTYKTRMGIKVATGGKSGFTAFGHSDMQYGNDPAKKTGFLHYTAYLSAVVTNPKHVVVVPDIFCQRYLGGMGHTYWTAEQYKATQSRRSRSIIAIPLPPTITELEKRIDIRGRWYTHQRLGFVTPERFENDLYPGAARINKRFGLYDPVRAGSAANSGRVPINYTLAQGMEWYFNTVTGRWDDYKVEQSPFGSKVYPKCGVVRNGQLKHLRDPDYNIVH